MKKADQRVVVVVVVELVDPVTPPMEPPAEPPALPVEPGPPIELVEPGAVLLPPAAPLLEVDVSLLGAGVVVDGLVDEVEGAVP